MEEKVRTVKLKERTKEIEKKTAKESLLKILKTKFV